MTARQQTLIRWLPLLMILGAGMACGLSGAEETSAERWLLCEECNAGELDSVVRLGDRAVSMLGEALAGPSLGRRENVRRQAMSSYGRLVAFTPAVPPRVSQAAYVTHFVDNYVATYQGRAAVALGRIGTTAAQSVLREALRRESLYRSDVLGFVRAALGLAVTPSAGNNQTAPVGQAVPVVPSVLVSDVSGQPLPGVLVTFSVASGGGFVTDSIQRSNAVGIATVGQWRLGSVPGPNTMSARVGEAGTTFVASASPGPPVALVNAGDNQRAAAGTATAVRPSVLATDGAGNPASGTGVTFTATAGGGTATGANQVTSASGIATVGEWRLGPTRGPNTLTATVLGQGPVVFSATATAPWDTILTLGTERSCALTRGVAYCWGRNDQGQLGTGATDIRETPVAVPGGWSFTSLSTGVGRHTCAIAANQNLPTYCWGSNQRGELGDGTTTRRLAPTPVAGSSAFRSVTVGGNHTCALTQSGAAFCWGDNGNGQLGDSTTNSSTTPKAVAGGLSFSQVAAGAFHTCGLTINGRVYCWGRNQDGQLGDGSLFDRATPVPTTQSPVTIFTSLAAGAFHTCSVAPARTIWCWGRNQAGQLGDSSDVGRSEPGLVSGGGEFVSVTAGRAHSCALSPMGWAYCWGANEYGALGDGSTASRRTPVRVLGDMRFAEVGAGDAHTCAVTLRRDVYCWGANSSGQLGRGSRGRWSTFPVLVAEP